MSDFAPTVDFEQLQKRLTELSPGRSVYEDWTQMQSPGGLAEALTVPFWGDAPKAWNRVYLSGVVLPGLATVTGTGYKRRVDRRKTAGQHGESTTDLGDDPSEIEITLTLWTEQHLRDFQTVVRRIVRKRTKPKRIATIEEQEYFVGLSSGAVNQSPANLYTSPNPYNLPMSTPARPDDAFEQAMKFGTPTYYRAEDAKKKAVVTSNADEEDAPGPVDIVHPALAIFRIRSVQIVEASLPIPKGAAGDVYEVRLKGREFIAQRGAKVTKADQSFSLTAALGGNAIDQRIGSRVQTPKPSTTNAGPGI